MSIDPLEIIDEYYLPGSKAHHVLNTHGKVVAEKALAIARHVKDLQPDLKFIEEGALLHDIGMIMTHVPELGCFGSEPYILHGLKGRQMLEERGLFKHALVCERHLLVGMSAAEILTSESQERMLAIVHPNHLDEVLEAASKWEITASVIGTVSDTQRYRVEDGVSHSDEESADAADTSKTLLADVPASALGDGPQYQRPMQKPNDFDEKQQDDPWLVLSKFEGSDLKTELINMISSPSVASKEWIIRQYGTSNSWY